MTLTSSSVDGSEKPSEQLQQPSSSSSAGYADDERSSSFGLGGDASGSDQNINHPQMLPQSGRIDAMLDATMMEGSPIPSSDEDSGKSDAELVEELGQELRKTRDSMVQELFDVCSESDNIPDALRRLSCEGISSLDPLLDAQLANLDNELQSYRD
ncbi:unnamed protein product [Sympodiomycopsis kandeliae]